MQITGVYYKISGNLSGMILRTTVLCTLFSLSSCLSSYKDDYTEELFIKPHPTGHVFNHFQFTTGLDANPGDNEAFRNVRLFPKSLADVISAYRIQELHLSLSHGLWRHDKWGYPIRPAPPGAELIVWFQEGVKDVDLQWKNFRNVLAGMFCASLNFMDTKSTANPQFSFRPFGATSKHYDKRIVSKSKNLRYAALPRETVCTENLTPWKKLLPCGDKFGLGTLLNARKLYDSHYHSLSVDFRPVCKNESCTTTTVELSMSLSVVFNVIDHGNRADWSLRDMFSDSIKSICPMSSSSKVMIDISSNKTKENFFQLIPSPSSVTRQKIKNEYLSLASYDLKDSLEKKSILNIIARYSRKILRKKVPNPVVTLQTYQTGYGEERGGITTVISNWCENERTVIFLQILPWYLRVYYHTLSFRNYFYSNSDGNGTRIRPVKLAFEPGKDRSKACSLEVVLKLPPKSITKIHFEIERVLLRWTEYPPDAHHGFYINSPILTSIVDKIEYPLGLQRSTNILSKTYLKNETGPNEKTILRIYSESLLMILPTPDFSMPYNVICLACTVVAIGFGSVHNVTTRLLIMVDPDLPCTPLGRIRQKFIQKIKGSFGKIRGLTH